MALPESGPISMSMVNTELGYSATAVITLNDAAVRTLFGKSSGAIALSDGYGKSAAIVYVYTGIIDTIGYRKYGRYFDGINSSTSAEVTGTYGYGESCDCCGADEYSNCQGCEFYSYTGAPISSSFKTNATGGYFDAGTDSAFVDFTVGTGPAAPTFGGDCQSLIPSINYYAGSQAGIKTNGTLWAWGTNDYGQLGDGTTTNRSSPVQIGTGTNWRYVRMGTSATFAIKTDGTLWSWGYGGQVDLGNGISNRSSPVQIGAGTDWNYVSSNGWQAGVHAIKTNGTLWGWGGNGYGTVGDGTTTSRSSPVQIGAGTDWATVSHGTYTTFAIKTNGTLWVWGFNYSGQLGDGTQINRSSPVQIGAGTNWRSVVGTNGYQNNATKTDGTFWGWGAGYYGIPANGYSFASSPVQVGSGTIHAVVPESSMKSFDYGVPVITTNGNLIEYNNGYNSGTFITTYSGSGATKVWYESETEAFIMKNAVTGSYLYVTQKAIFGYGVVTGVLSMTNLVSNTGVVSTDTTGVGTQRAYLAAASYGSDKAIFGYGFTGALSSLTNKVSNTGVVATDTTGVGTARFTLAAAGYGSDKAIFGYGWNNASTYYSITNKVSNTGVAATDTTGVGTGRQAPAAAGFGTQKAIFGYGYNSSLYVSMTNLIGNTGGVASDTTGVGTARLSLSAASYGSGKAIFGYGYNGGNLSMTNKVSNTGVVESDTTGVGTGRYLLAAAGYGIDKAIFGYGYNGGNLSMTNKVSNTGVVESDTTGVGTARYGLAAAGYSV
jgi:hypothetical protein